MEVCLQLIHEKRTKRNLLMRQVPIIITWMRKIYKYTDAYIVSWNLTRRIASIDSFPIIMIFRMISDGKLARLRHSCIGKRDRRTKWMTKAEWNFVSRVHLNYRQCGCLEQLMNWQKLKKIFSDTFSFLLRKSTWQTLLEHFFLF